MAKESILYCPDCRVMMAKDSSYGATVDQCVKCKGTWFDDGELSEFLEQALSRRDDIPDDKIRLEREIERRVQKEEDRKECPNCNILMEKRNFSYNSNIFIDVCPECNGSFVDSESLEKLLIHRKGNPQVTAYAEAMGAQLNSSQKIRNLGDMGRSARARSGVFNLLPKLAFPLRDDQPSTLAPFATIAILLVTFGFFAYGSWISDAKEAWIARYALVPERLASPGEWLAIFGATFLHSNWVVMVINLLFLWVFGDNVEDKMGHWRFALFYLLGGAFGWLFHIGVYWGATVGATGATAAVAAVMGAYMIFQPRAGISLRLASRSLRIPAFVFIAIWLGINVFYGLMYKQQDAYFGIAWYAHLGGFLFGMIVAWVMLKNDWILRPDKNR